MLRIMVCLMMCCSSCTAVPVVKDTFPSKSHLVLPEIQIKGNAMVAKRRGDTLIFSADRYKTLEAIRLEQLLSNVPGFQVDPSGRISFNGRPIKKLMLDGDDLTAENYQLLSKNMRSLMIDSIQVVEKYNENRLLKNVQGSNDIAVNLVLKQAYYGKPNINTTTAYAPKRNGELQIELIQLSNRLKQMVVGNANTIGSSALHYEQEEQKVIGNKQYLLFRSWPDLLNNILPSSLDHKYVNQNADWGISVAHSIRVKKHHRLRVNMSKSSSWFTSTSAQYQFIASVADSSVLLFSKQVQKRKQQNNKLNLHWEIDKGNKQRTIYELEGYTLNNADYSNEMRKLTTAYQLDATSGLQAKGFRFKFDHTRKTAAHKVWQWEVLLNGSANNYTIEVIRNDVVYMDSFANNINQVAKHNGVHVQASLGHSQKSTKNSMQYWFRTAVTQLYSNQDQQSLHVKILKSYISTNISRALSKKINFHFQSMFGFTQVSLNRNGKSELTYHIDQGFTWRPKPTRQLAFNYGVLKQEPSVGRFFAGTIYTNSTTKVTAPTMTSFPFTLYSQLYFSFLDLYNGVNFYTQLMVREVRGDYFMSSYLDPFYTTIAQQIAERQISASLNVHLEKIIHPIRMKYRLSYGIMYVNSPAQFTVEKFTAVNTVASVGQHISTNWRKGVNVQFDYQFIQSQFLGISTPTVKNIRYDYKGTFEFRLSRFLNAHLIVNRYSGRTLKPFDLLDLKMNWSPNLKYRFFINGINLFNKKLFVLQTLNSNSMSINEQYLIGRRISVGADIPL